MSDTTYHGFKVVEKDIPPHAQFALVGDREAAILLADGEIIVLVRNAAGYWDPKI